LQQNKSKFIRYVRRDRKNIENLFFKKFLIAGMTIRINRQHKKSSEKIKYNYLGCAAKIFLFVKCFFTKSGGNFIKIKKESQNIGVGDSERLL
jgi:hypothetical protein